MYCKNDILRNSKKDNILNRDGERGIVWDRFRPACKKQFAKNKNHSVVGVAKLSDGKSLPVSFCPTRFGEVDQETHGLRLCFTKMTKMRSVYSGPPGCKAAPCTPRLRADRLGLTAGRGGDPRRAWRFITTSKGEPRTSVCAAAHRPHPPASPPHPGCNPTQASAKTNIKDSQCRARPNLG